MMSGNIWKWDQYDLRKFSPGSIDYFLDIGACVGTTSLLFKAIDPWARVIAVEPCKEDFEFMSVAAGTWDIKCYNMALGDGKPLCFGRKKQGAHRFYTDEEKQWWPEKPEYFVDSKTLPQLFEYFKITGRYIIKVDCEGGERFLLDDQEAIEIVRGTIQFNIEYHRGFGGEQERWHEWFRNFKDTHKLFHRTLKKDGFQSVFEKTAGPDERWRGEYMLVRI
ncbi:MAG: FkbM family methyltransferase [Planctomycetota bacterium]|jgi:FkbM family methyltransferase